MKKIIISLFFLSAAFSPAFAKNTNIALTDGSVINGQVLSYSNGVYTVASQGMGTVRIEESKIKNIGFEPGSNNPSPAPANDNNQFSGQTEALRNKIMSNPQVMDSIQSLKDDPQVQEIINDPEIIAAIKAGDLNALSKNEKFMGLTRNPKIQKIKDEASN